MQDDPTTSRPSRRQVLRASAWVPPVVLAVEAAPAYAASVGPLVVTATRGGIGTSVRLTFTGGDAALLVTILSVTYDGGILGTVNVPMTPTTVSSTGGVSDGTALSALVGRVYTVSYRFNGVIYTQTATLP